MKIARRERTQRSQIGRTSLMVAKVYFKSIKLPKSFYLKKGLLSKNLYNVTISAQIVYITFNALQKECFRAEQLANPANFTTFDL